MAIRLSSNCTNCAQLSEVQVCDIHQVKVSPNYTCDSFSQNLAEFFSRQCTNCSRFNSDSCPHPSKAAAEMLCTSWAPMLDS